MEKLRLGLLLSGNGSVLKTLLAAIADRSLDATVDAVITNRECPALTVAVDAGIPVTRRFNRGEYESKAAMDSAIADTLLAAGVRLAVVGGYSENIDEAFFRRFGDNIIGMYPALLPAFQELPEAVGPALEYGVKLIGVTVHFRTADSGSGGAIIAQEPIRVSDEDTIESIEKRVIEIERELLPRVLNAFAHGQVIREDHRVRVRSGDPHPPI